MKPPGSGAGGAPRDGEGTPPSPDGNDRPAPDGAAGSATATGERSIAINTGGAPFLGVASTGDNTTIVHVPPGELRSPSEVDAPPGLVRLPASHSGFVGRARELELLDQALAGAGTAVVQALHGLGGVGKSALAAHWAATRHGAYSPVWWITADTPAALDTGLADLARALQPALAQLPQDQLTERAVQWLATHRGWLLVLDNVEDPGHIAPLLARARTGRVLVTSRRSAGWHDTATPVRLDVLSPAEALELLSRILTGARPDASLEGAAELCAELGHLPLAVEQAGAYIAEAGITPRAYLDLLAAYPAEMYRETAELGDSERTIARIWRLTLDRLAETPLAGQVLRILAWYAPNGIPRTLLDPLGPPPAVQGAVRRLAAYSMISAEPRSLAVHRLVQAVARTPDADDPHRRADDITTALHTATGLLLTALPSHWQQPGDWPTWHGLLPHIDALTDHAPPDTDTHDTARILNHTGLFLDGQGLAARAIDRAQRATTACERVLGPDHPDTLASRYNLASAYETAGDLARALPLHRQTLDDRLRVLGPDHPDTLSSRNNLARAYSSTGDLGRAVPQFEQTLEDRLRVLGPDHPDTLTSRNNLAHAYQEKGDLARAIPLYEQTLDDRLRVLGEDHPSTLVSRNNLATGYAAAGDLSRAVPQFEQLAEDRLRVLGPDHPQTLTSRNNLALVRQAAGDLDRAIPLYEQTLDDRLRVLGPDHPDTLSSRNNLAAAHEAAGNLDRAVPLYERTLQDMARVLGEDHPSTFTARNNLATAYETAKDFARALPLYEQTLQDRLRVLGEDHPDTLTSRNNLAHGHASAGDLDRAIPLYEQTLDDRVRVLGEDHPSTLVSRNNLAHGYRSAGDLGRAVPMYRRALQDMVRVLGKNHPMTKVVAANLAAAVEAGRSGSGR